MDDVRGRVTIAPQVLTTIVRMTALEQRGVRRLASVPPKVRGLLAGTAAEEGIFIEVAESGVLVQLHVVAEADNNMLRLGEALQAGVTRAIEEMVGMHVLSVDVHIDDVVLPVVQVE
jgi:uncharacterized alkaline shock family protein YloU